MGRRVRTRSAPVSAVGLALGFAADALFADPARAHPVAAFGRAADTLERKVWRDSRGSGAGYALACVGGAAAVGWALTRVGGRTLATAAATWAVLGGASLVREGEAMSHLLSAVDLPGARRRLGHLCARDASELSAAELTRATVESLAENTSDAVVAPLFWGAVAGVPGLLAYRAINTLDAMIGYRSPRYARFGWAAARLDDVANLVPARFSAVLTAGLAPLVGGSVAATARVIRRDGRQHPSPNAGLCEAAFAGALDVRLGGTNQYGSATETRPLLGDGRAPELADIARATRLSQAVGLAAAGSAIVIALLGRTRRVERQ
jgi:adenosylcobinamide-phosphate synthase